MKGLRRAARSGATIGWLVSFPISFAVAVHFAPSWAMASGMPVALRFHLPWSGAVMGVALGALGLLATTIQLAGVLVGWAAGRLIGGSEETAASAEAATRTIRMRDRIGLALYLLPQGFPISLLFVPALPKVWAAGGWLASRNRAVAGVAKGFYVALFCAGSFVLYRWAPFFTSGHVALLLALPLAAAALAGGPAGRAAARPGRATLASVAAALALSRAIWPPVDLALSLRIVVACVLAVVGFLPIAFLSARASSRLGGAAVFCTTLTLGLYAHWAILFGAPSPGSVARIESQPGVRVEVPLPGPAAFSENRFYIDGCAPGERYFGSRETWHGLTRVAPPSSSPPSLPIDSGNNMILECGRGEGWLGDYARGVIHRIDLSGFRILPEPLARGSSGPTLIQLGSSGKNVYAMDDSGAVQAFDVATGKPGFGVRTCVTNGFFADEDRGRLYVASCGDLYVYDLATRNLMSQLDLRSGFTLPFPFETHFHRVAADPQHDRIYVTYAEIGAVFRISGTAMRIEKMIRIENGGRDALFDPLSNLLFVGNYATGNLVVIDPESLDVLARIFVGKRIRNIARSPHGPRLTLTSAAGGIAIDLPVALTSLGWRR